MSDDVTDVDAFELHRTLTRIADQIEDLILFAEDMGHRAVQHKLEESSGRLASAAQAAEQYAIGALEVR